jgi:hypothetical protein
VLGDGDAGAGGCGFDAGGERVGRGAPADGSVGALGVVDVDEAVKVAVEVVEGLGGGLSGEPAFEGLVEPFDFPQVWGW